MSTQIKSFQLLRNTIHALEIEDVVKVFEQWISEKQRSHYVAFCNVHMLMEARNSSYFRSALASADLVVPDGMPLIWAARRHGFQLHRRVYGPDVFMEFCKTTSTKSYRHFLFGGHPGVPEAVAQRLAELCGGIQIAGVYSPPFRTPTRAEQNDTIARINDSGADVLWVALGCPKQELWMYENRDRLNVPVVAGVGQAFDLYAGRVRQAPKQLRDNGLEWAFRLVTDPRRLWRRYLATNTQFLYCLALDGLGLLQPHEGLDR